MRERINRLAKGIIDMETPKLRIQPETLNEEIHPGERVRRELFLISENGLHVKGLIYSSNLRVQPAVNSFGGLRNHISYEIDSRHLEYGDRIEGSFFLVTNGGEQEIPYCFTAEAGASGRMLGRLKTPKDFAAMAKEDFAAALRVFEYRDFVDVPFMQDRGIRALYDGLRGHGSRQGQLEQFLIGMGVKEPAQCRAETGTRTYDDTGHVIEDQVELRRKGWGYLPVTVTADGDFIRLEKKTLEEEDFSGGVCQYRYRILPGSLHSGRNFGRICFETMYGTDQVEIQVRKERIKPQEPERPRGDMDARMHLSGGEKERLAACLFMRLEYESGKQDPKELEERMLGEIESLKEAAGRSLELTLLEAELCALSGRKEAASLLLSECRETMAACRKEEPALYGLFQYVQLLVQPDEQKKEALSQLLKKYLEEGTADWRLFYLHVRCEENYYFENPGELLGRMKALYDEGCRSPFLYQQALKLFEEMPQLLCGMGGLELQTLYFGARRHQVSEELAVKAAGLAAAGRNGRALCGRMLKLLYEQYPRKEILEAVCSRMIKGDCRREEDFFWYEKALEEHLSLTRLYEYFLYSLPQDYGHLIPKEVLLYFSYDHELDQNSRAVLYANIVRYMNPDTALYREYQKAIGAFAAAQLLDSRIDSRLAVIYDAMMYEDMIDEAIARVLPSVLRAYRVTCQNDRMRSVVVCYEELTDEGVCPIQKGTAYVPVFSGACRILFQDAYGNRYSDIGFVKVPVMDKPELEKRCYQVYPDHPMLLLGACRRAAESEVPEDGEVPVLEQALAQLHLHPLYRRMLTGKLIAWYRSRGGRPGAMLPEIDESLLSREQRTEYCEALMEGGYMREAFGLLREYRCPVSAKLLQKLCSRMILNQLFDQDDQLLGMSFFVFSQGLADGVILDYLCEHFNGTSEQMYQVLEQAVREHVETYDLEERLLAQMLFSSCLAHADQVFDWYMTRKKTGESLVKAYFTVKSAEYYLRDAQAGDQVFRYLEGMVQGAIEKEKLSAIYLLALTKYYSRLPELDGEQKELCQTAVDILLADGMVFPHFQKLASQIRVPDEVQDKGIIQYIGRKDSRVELQIRILPQQERFGSDEMKRVYQGIFIRQKVLFEGETLEYRIYEHEGEERILKAEGTVAGGAAAAGKEGGRFRMLNEMSACLNRKEEDGLKQAMKEYVEKTAAAEQLFGLWTAQE